MASEADLVLRSDSISHHSNNAFSSDDDDGGMMEAVGRLAEALKREDVAGLSDGSGSVDDAETAALIDKIESQITRLMGDPGSVFEEDEEGDEETPQGSRSSNANSRRRGGGAGSKKRAHLAYYPTPYELWRKSHEVVQVTKAKKTLTESQWKEVVERLNDSSKARYVANMRAEHRLIAEELSSLPFSPRINARSREIAQVAPLHERLTHILKMRHEKLEKHRQKQMDREIASLTGTPQINKTTMWTPRVRNVYTNREHPDKDEGELTFHPQISAKSRRLVRQAKRREREAREESFGDGGLDEQHISRAGIGKLKISPKMGREEETFHPQINYRSRALAHRQGDGPAHERLYSMAKQKMYTAAREDVRNVAKHWRRGSVEAKRAVRLRSPPRRSRHVARSQLVGATTEDEAAMAEGSSAILSRDPRYGGINVVKYDPKFRFILDRVTGADEYSTE